MCSLHLSSTGFFSVNMKSIGILLAIIAFVELVIRWLAEIETGDEDNTWIVNKLIELYRMRSTEEPYDAILPLGVSHFNDQWWIGAKSYVSWHE